MKVQLKSTAAALGKRLLPVFVMMMVFMMPVLLFATNPDDNPGDNPDYRPPAVPLSAWMSIILVVAGLLLGAWVIKRRNAKKVMVLQTVINESK